MKLKIALIHGGTSTEQEISTKNAGHIEQALIRLGHETSMIAYDVGMLEKIRTFAPDTVFLCVQGKGHGDGTLQGLLDFLAIPYTGSHTEAAAIINDKIVCKELFAYHGIRTPGWRVLSNAEYRAGGCDFSSIGFPFVAKAPTQGGSYGLQLVMSAAEIHKIEDVFTYDDPIFIERYVSGRFATVGLLQRGNKLETFPCVEVTNTETSGLVTINKPYTVKPDVFSREASAEMEDLSRKVFQVTRARGYGRVDFMVSSRDGLPYVLEINAVPGLKPVSLYPQAASYMGLSYETMIETILLGALEPGRPGISGENKQC
jgi:D-alanine-D-alanine ligase/UDP-N-acetylmuramate--alanine ligase